VHAPLIEHASEHGGHRRESAAWPKLLHHIAHGSWLNLRQDGQDLSLKVRTFGGRHGPRFYRT
jgi:hypothetical protein